MQVVLRICFVVSFSGEKEEKLKITEMSEFRKQGVTILSGKVVGVFMMVFFSRIFSPCVIVYSSFLFIPLVLNLIAVQFVQNISLFSFAQ